MSNGEGGYFSISLSTGRCINHRSLTPLMVPAEVITQLHHLVWQAKAKKTLNFTNTNDEDLDVLYATLDQDGDDVNPNHNNDKLAGVDKEDNEYAKNNKY